MFRQLFRRPGLSAGSPTLPDALLKIKNEKFDLILLDLKLKQGSGVTLVEAVRTNKGGFNHSTPIIVASAYVDEDILVQLKSMVNAFVVKPYNPDAVVAKIKHWCSSADIVLFFFINIFLKM